jgi:hypothetical protein
MTDKKLSVSEHLEAGNSWYEAEHESQIITPETREIVEKRWVAIQLSLAKLKVLKKLKHKFKILDAGCVMVII